MPFDGNPSDARHGEAARISLSAVNGWRGPGALAIAVAHFGVATDYFVVRHIQPIALLVDLFFVLSGLLLAQAYTEKLSHAAAIPEYIIRRFGRIWPVHAATLAALLAYELLKLLLQTFAGKSFSSPPFSPDGLNLVPAISSNLLLIHSLGIHDRETWNYPSWSLSVEFVTYVIFALFCLVAPFVRRFLSAVMIVTSIAILVLVAPHHMRSTYDYGVFRCLAGFFAGTLCYDLVKRWRLPAWPMPTLVEISSVVAVIVWMGYGAGTPLAYAAPLVFCLFIVAFIQERGLLSRILLTKPFQMMAELSFAIYMVHALVLIGLFSGLHEYARATGTRLFVLAANSTGGFPATTQELHVDGTLSKWALCAAYVALVLGAAYLAYRVVETPGRALFGSVARRVTPRPLGSTAKAEADALARVMERVP